MERAVIRSVTVPTTGGATVPTERVCVTRASTGASATCVSFSLSSFHRFMSLFQHFYSMILSLLFHHFYDFFYIMIVSFLYDHLYSIILYRH